MLIECVTYAINTIWHHLWFQQINAREKTVNDVICVFPPIVISKNQSKCDNNLNYCIKRHLNLPNHSKQHMVVCGLSLHQGSTESRKTLEQTFIFQIGSLNPHGINERFSFRLKVRREIMSHDDLILSGNSQTCRTIYQGQSLPPCLRRSGCRPSSIASPNHIN